MCRMGAAGTKINATAACATNLAGRAQGESGGHENEEDDDQDHYPATARRLRYVSCGGVLSLGVAANEAQAKPGRKGSQRATEDQEHQVVQGRCLLRLYSTGRHRS